jgi:hypothetical protein
MVYISLFLLETLVAVELGFFEPIKELFFVEAVYPVLDSRLFLFSSQDLTAARVLRS